MIDHRPREDLGRTEISGLHGVHHFCFARYQHPDRLQWDRLRIWNDYRLEPGHGRPPQPCDNFDIITVVRSGMLQRPGSFGDKCVVRAGEAQVLSTGHGSSIGLTAIGDQPALFHEIWLITEDRGEEPRSSLLALAGTDGWHPIASDRGGDGALPLTSSARVSLANVPPQGFLTRKIGRSRHAYLVPVSGSVRLGRHIVTEGSGAAIRDEAEITVEAPAGAQLILIESGPREASR